jgi:hypothetical protein
LGVVSLNTDMPDLEGGRLVDARTGKIMLYFESLCGLFRLEDSTGDASKLSSALPEWPDHPSSSDAIKIGRGFDASMGTVKKSKKQ